MSFMRLSCAKSTAGCERSKYKYLVIFLRQEYAIAEPVQNTEKGLIVVMTLGASIKALRKARALTQEQLAEALNVSPQAVSKWETGLSCPDVGLLPTLALVLHTTMDRLFDFDRARLDREVDALVRESVPLRETPERAEAFYRAALERYPNHEVLLNCLLMVIPDERYEEKLEIGERLLACTEDDEIKYDVLRLLALSCHARGEDALAERYLVGMPELYFLKTELTAAIRQGPARLEEIKKTEDVCIGTLLDMLSLRNETEPDTAERNRALAHRLLELYGQLLEHREQAERLRGRFDAGR